MHAYLSYCTTAERARIAELEADIKRFKRGVPKHLYKAKRRLVDRANQRAHRIKEALSGK